MSGLDSETKTLLIGVACFFARDLYNRFVKGSDTISTLSVRVAILEEKTQYLSKQQSAFIRTLRDGDDSKDPQAF